VERHELAWLMGGVDVMRDRRTTSEVGSGQLQSIRGLHRRNGDIILNYVNNGRRRCPRLPASVRNAINYDLGIYAQDSGRSKAPDRTLGSRQWFNSQIIDASMPKRRFAPAPLQAQTNMPDWGPDYTRFSAA
jgi:hypothetical protein